MLRSRTPLLAPLLVALALTGCSSAPAARTAASLPPVSETATGTPAPTPSDAASSPAVSPTAQDPTPPPTTTPVTQTPDPTPTARLELNGGNLGVTRFGVPFAQAQAAITAVLGKPSADPKKSVTCINADREVAFGDFVIASRGGKLAGWSSASRTLQAPSGVTVGTDLPTLRRVYGLRLQLFDANPDQGRSFGVKGIDFGGTLSGPGAAATVTSLRTAFCSGP